MSPFGEQNLGTVDTVHGAYLEVDAAVAVLVEYPEDLVDEDGGVAGGQDHGVHVEHLRLVQDSVRAVGLRGYDVHNGFMNCLYG